MKLSTKLLLSYFAVAFLVLLVGAGSYFLNKNIKDGLIDDSHRSITEIQKLSTLEFSLQNSLLFTRNFLFEKSRERVANPSEVQLRIRSAEEAARDHLTSFKVKLDSIRMSRPAPETVHETLEANYEQLNHFLDSLSVSFELYSSLIIELFMMDDSAVANEMFDMTIEPYFRSMLLPLIEEFRVNQGNRVDLQMASLRSQADRNARIIIIITCIAFIIASWLAYLMHDSIARPLKHLALAAEGIGAGDLEQRIQIGTNDELSQLGESFNTMAGNLERSMVSREYVNNIIQSMGDMLLVTDSDFQIVLINRNITETLYYSENELLGAEIWSLITDEDVDYLKQRLTGTEQNSSFETKFTTLRGDEIPVIISFSYLRELQGTSKGIVFVASNITSQKEAEEKVSRSLKEKEVLLAEIHHRVKNNLAVISGLLEMQVWNLPENDPSIGPLKESQLRIHSIALVHELLYQSETLAEIKLDEYTLKLLDAIEKTHKKSEKQVDIKTSLAPVRLTIHQAIPASLMLNELLVNAFKHAFTGREKGEIFIRLSESDSRISLSVTDDGVGLPDGFDPKSQKTLGMTLVKTLVQQLNAELDVTSVNGTGLGTSFSVSFEAEG